MNRRDFLQLLGSAAAVASLPALAVAQSKSVALAEPSREAVRPELRCSLGEVMDVRHVKVEIQAYDVGLDGYREFVRRDSYKVSVEGTLKGPGLRVLHGLLYDDNRPVDWTLRTDLLNGHVATWRFSAHLCELTEYCVPGMRECHLELYIVGAPQLEIG